MFRRTTVICVVDSDLKKLLWQKEMELTREHIRSSIFTTFDVDYHDKSAVINLYLAIMHHTIALSKTALMNSIVDHAG